MTHVRNTTSDEKLGRVWEQGYYSCNLKLFLEEILTVSLPDNSQRSEE